MTHPFYQIIWCFVNLPLCRFVDSAGILGPGDEDGQENEVEDQKESDGGHHEDHDNDTDGDGGSNRDAPLSCV